MKAECDACGYDTTVTPYPVKSGLYPNEKPKEKQLCDLCAKTMIGVFIDYPAQHDHDALEVMKHINFIGNVILDAIRKAGKP